MPGVLHDFFGADHRRLDAILARALADPGRVDLAPFGEFRAGLLRHIGMEEKVLFVSARRQDGGGLEMLAKLRVDHGAIASLLVPTPTPAIISELLSILGPHNRREEDRGGAYDLCDEAIGETEARRLVRELAGFPDPPLRPHNDTMAVFEHIRINVDLARRQWMEA